MSREQEPKSLEQLIQERGELSELIKQRQELVGRIGSGRVRLGERPEKDAQIGRLRKKATLAADRWRGEFVALVSRISVLEEEEDQRSIEGAERYLQEVTTFRGWLEEIRGYTREGYLPKDILEKREGEYRLLAARPGSNLGLKRGLELLRARREKTVAAEVSSEEVVAEEKRIEKVPPRQYQIILPDGTVIRSKKETVIKHLEAFDPEALQKIVYYLGIIDGKGIRCPINNHTLVTVFGLSKGEVNQIQEKRWITPAKGKDHHPVYLLAEVVTVLYCHDNNHGLTKQIAKAVQRLTQQEIDKREKKTVHRALLL